MRNANVSGLTFAELDHARRELVASLALAWPESPIRVTIQAQISAIDAEVAKRRAEPTGVGLAP
jgi:hypothetical protein